jgi:hypothetical protein
MELVPVNIYRAMAVPFETDGGPSYVQFGTSKNGGEQVGMQFEIISGPEAGRRVPWYGSFSEKLGERAKKTPAQRTIESLRLCGFKGNDLANMPSQELNQEVSITVEHNEWEGKITCRVQWVNEPGSGGVRMANPLGQTELRRFAASMKTKVAGIGEIAGKPAVREAPTPAPATNGSRQPGDDDLTF